MLSELSLRFLGSRDQRTSWNQNDSTIINSSESQQFTSALLTVVSYVILSKAAQMILILCTLVDV